MPENGGSTDTEVECCEDDIPTPKGATLACDSLLFCYDQGLSPRTCAVSPCYCIRVVVLWCTKYLCCVSVLLYNGVMVYKVRLAYLVSE